MTEFSAVARVEIVRENRPERTGRLFEAEKQGRLRGVLVNSAASAWMVPYLSEADVRIVGLVHEMEGLLEERRLGPDLRALIDRADAVVFPSSIVRDSNERFLDEALPQAIIRPQGLFRGKPIGDWSDKADAKRRLSKELGIDPARILCLGVGYGDHRKGLDRFVAWAVHARTSAPDMVFVWVGDVDPTLAEVLCQAKVSSSVSNLIMPGYMSDLEPYYRAADLFTLPSREDPFPSVVLDALAGGAVTISISGATGVEDLALSGAVIPMKDAAPATFLETVRPLLENEETRRSRGLAGRDLIRSQFGFRSYVDEISRLLTGESVATVSAVVPNYNYARHLPERLRSIANQTLLPSEIIFLDDASTDGSVAVASDLLDEVGINWSLSVNSANSGDVFAQWRRGIEAARSEYVWIAEADDNAATTFLEQVAGSVHRSGAAMGFCQSMRIDEEDRITAPDYQDVLEAIAGDRWRRSYHVAGPDELAAALYLKNTIPNVSAVIFRRSALLTALDALKEELPRYRVAGDWRIYVEILQKGTIAHVSEVLNRHRIHDASVTRGHFGPDELAEIARVQAAAASSLPPSASRDAEAARYLARLSDEMGL